MKLRDLTLMCVTLAALLSSTATAQDRFLAEIYGEGVHAFQRGNISAARNHLDTAISSGYNDPRAYYFRAFAKLRNGDSFGAESDIRMGAELEVSGAGAYDIGRALERVQGHDRLKFEALRRGAMIAAMRNRAFLQEAAPPLTPPAPPVPDAPFPTPVRPADDNADDPFADDVEDNEVLEAPGARTGDAMPADDAMFDDFDTNNAAPNEAEGFDGPAEIPADDASLFDDAPAADAPAADAPAAEGAADEGAADEEDLFGGDDADLFGDEPLESKGLSDEALNSLFED